MIRIEAAGPEALMLVLADQPDELLLLRIARLAERIQGELGGQITDLVPGWTSLLVHFDLLYTDPGQLTADLQSILQRWQNEPLAARQGRLHELPVCYNGEDLNEVARLCQLTPQQVISLHSAPLYQVGAIGFAPGFAYLGTLDARLALPRRSTPRVSVPAGSLAIAERQTAIYPQRSPGGWHLLGRCPWPLFDPAHTPPCPLKVGDRVRFIPVDERRFISEGGEL